MATDQAVPAALTVMSFNLRYPAADAHPWRRRRAAAQAVINQELPALIATQEGVYDQLQELVSGLDDRYAWTGEGRDGGDAGEFCAVLYDRRRIRFEAGATRWLSPTPEERSRGWGSSHRRIATLVDVTDLRAGRQLRFISTHLDHRSAQARSESARLLRRWAAEGGAAVVAGDFNEPPDGPAHRLLCAAGSDEAAPPLRDAFAADVPRAGDDVGSFHGYRDRHLGGPRIDWILHSAALTALSSGVSQFRLDGQAPSDHWPVQAQLRWLGPDAGARGT
ncbi:endonuclease/exonuclease/phosphatase family protein [Sediminivirga luteola]|uniref:Metal-dependent hydrolase n=1 Tax=Sediminivirga luteola TaxID=1774748 RepID=A0A8J2TYT9_9MICO|nr:endonuclease/exonuclease/phosphatase family protein [Sediminivirga luteola]GGA17355.1 metal-dependent hydrolase [Sediminivirga luteola]